MTRWVAHMLAARLPALVQSSAAGSSAAFGEQRPSLAWLNCFDSNSSRIPYAESVYGRGAGEWFDWTSGLGLVHPKHMQGLNRSCWFSTKGIYRRYPPIGQVGKDVLSWVDYRPRSDRDGTRHDNRGGPRRPARVVDWSWTEVIHLPHLGGAMSNANLWMYAVKGSGLWFNAGRVLDFSDTIDLAIYLYGEGRNASSALSSYGARMHLIHVATQRLSSQFDTISFSNHVDRGCCFAAVMHELISLKQFSLKCPVSADMRRGWPPDRLRPCTCRDDEPVC